MSKMANLRPHAGDLRKGRHSQLGCFYFLTTTVAGRRRLFTKQDRAIIVLDAIRWLHAANRFIVDAAVVMPDHLHLVGQLGERSRQDAAPTLANVMHTLKSYSANCLAKTGVATPVWQEGYHDHGLRDDEDYRVRVRYVIQNPLRAGLVQRVEDFPHVVLPEWWSDSEG
jgi:REP element-mobilizing transposase RayT